LSAMIFSLLLSWFQPRCVCCVRNGPSFQRARPSFYVFAYPPSVF
jgi:hypothetical protein